MCCLPGGFPSVRAHELTSDSDLLFLRHYARFELGEMKFRLASPCVELCTNEFHRHQALLLCTVHTFWTIFKLPLSTFLYNLRIFLPQIYLTASYRLMGIHGQKVMNLGMDNIHLLDILKVCTIHL